MTHKTIPAERVINITITRDEFWALSFAVDRDSRNLEWKHGKGKSEPYKSVERGLDAIRRDLLGGKKEMKPTTQAERAQWKFEDYFGYTGGRSFLLRENTLRLIADVERLEAQLAGLRRDEEAAREFPSLFL